MKLSQPRFWLYASLLLLPLMVACHEATTGHLLDDGPLFVAAIPFGIGLGAFYAHFSHCWGRVPSRRPSWGKQLFDASYLSMLAIMMVGIIFRGLNLALDASPPQSVRLRVLNRHVSPPSRGRSSTLLLRVSNPLQDPRKVFLSVSEPFYLAHPAGSTIAARLRRGRLGAPWLEPLE